MSVADTPTAPAVEYPESDGEPMSDNTIQFRWITLLATNAQTAFGADPNVFVAADLLIYPVEGDPKVRAAPDLMVAFGRPNGDRRCYQVWQEGEIFPQVVVEVLSPGNRADEMEAKLVFYERYGAEEYIIVRPEPWRGLPAGFAAYQRRGGVLAPVPPEGAGDYVSPNLGFRFSREAGDVVAYGLDGQPLKSHGEVTAERDAARRAEAEAKRAEAEAKRAAAEANAARDQLAAKLRALGLDPDAP